MNPTDYSKGLYWHGDYPSMFMAMNTARIMMGLQGVMMNRRQIHEQRSFAMALYHAAGLDADQILKWFKAPKIKTPACVRSMIASAHKKWGEVLFMHIVDSKGKPGIYRTNVVPFGGDAA